MAAPAAGADPAEGGGLTSGAGVLDVGGVRLSYETHGHGPPVVLVMGLGGTGRVWHLHQVPALVAAGYRVLTFDHRGIGRSEPGPPGMTVSDLVADTAALVEHLGDGPAAVVGTSLGARITAELALARPELVRQAVLLAGHARLDETQRTLSAGEIALIDGGTSLPPSFRAAVSALHNLSPATRADPARIRDWLDVFELSPPSQGPGARAQLALSDFPDRTDAYRAISTPTLVVGFADDVMIPPYLCREVAVAIPSAEYVELERCGHVGYLERPDAVNERLVGFLDRDRPGA